MTAEGPADDAVAVLPPPYLKFHSPSTTAAPWCRTPRTIPRRRTPATRAQERAVAVPRDLGTPDLAVEWADKQRRRPRRPSEPVGYALHVRSASSTAGMLASLRAHDRNNCGAALLFPACARKRAAASSHHSCRRNPWPGA